MNNENRLRPKLVVSDAAKAVDFYARVLGAKERARYTHGDTIVASETVVFGTVIALKDADGTDPVLEPGPILDVVCENPDEFVQAIADAGGEVIFPVEDQPYGARAGRARDPFGVQWLLQTEVTISPDQVQRALDEMGG